MMSKSPVPISKGMLLFTVILMDLLAGMEFDLFVPSFPELQSHFSLSPFLVESLLSVNFIGYCLSLFFVGGLADRYGRKPILLLGITTFVVGSVFCLWATSYPFLLVGRFLQGVGVAAPAILSFLIIADSYPLKQQQFLMMMLNGVMNTAAGLAPTIGSYITLYFYWQGNFKVLLLLGGLTFVMTLLFIPHQLLKQKERSSPYGYIQLFQSKPLMLLIAHIVFMIVPYWIFVGMSPLLYMQGLGVSLSHFGYYQGSLALIFALGSVLLGFIIKRCNQKSVLYAAYLIFIVSLISLGAVIISDSHSPLLITLAFIPFIIGQIPASILYPLCLNFMPKEKGKIAAVIQGGRLLFCALGLQIAGFHYSGSFQTIGIIIMSFIFLTVITLFLVMKNGELMKGHQE
jgi:DHA1 family bicyclomycin/chloramphenicol resistance-like MFS transporter